MTNTILALFETSNPADAASKEVWISFRWIQLPSAKNEPQPLTVPPLIDAKEGSGVLKTLPSRSPDYAKLCG
jgi:hypothetical protein